MAIAGDELQKELWMQLEKAALPAPPDRIDWSGCALARWYVAHCQRLAMIRSPQSDKLRKEKIVRRRAAA